MSDGAPTLLNGTVPRMTDLQLATTDSTDGRFSAGASAWGIYLQGVLVIEPDSIVALDYHREWTLADYPIEGGGFETYDKVAKPFDIRLRITKGGSEADRTQFLADVEAISASLSLYDILTPEKSYLSVNVTSLANSRTATNGMGLVIIDLGLRQIRMDAVATVGATTTSVVAPAAPSGATPVNGGTVQPQPITKPATQAEIKAAVAEARAGFDANMFSTPAF